MRLRGTPRILTALLLMLAAFGIPASSGAGVHRSEYSVSGSSACEKRAAQHLPDAGTNAANTPRVCACAGEPRSLMPPVSGNRWLFQRPPPFFSSRFV